MSLIDQRIAELDRLISAQLNEIIHHEDFQRLEASWRGLHYFVKQAVSSEYYDKTLVKIKVLSATKRELIKDFKKSIDFDKSTLFEKVYEEVYNTYGSDPFGVLIGDFEFSNHPQDVILLERIADVAATAHAPFISAASAQFFGWDSFTDVSETLDALQQINVREEFRSWRNFRESGESRYVGLTMPRVLMREPYETVKPTDAFHFEENIEGEFSKKYLWGNAAYALATRLTEAFVNHGLCADICGSPGGVVKNLPTHTFATDNGEVVMRKCEVANWGNWGYVEVNLEDNGFSPICQSRGVDFLYFLRVPSATKPKKYDTDQANSNARLATQLQYIFVMSRFAHYLMVMCRDRKGCFMSREEIARWLNRWISDYRGTFDEDSEELKAKYPLGDALLDVSEIPGNPGSYRAVGYLRPRFQIEEPSVSFRIVVTLPAQIRLEENLLCLEFISYGRYQGRRFPLVGERFSIGRDDDCIINFFDVKGRVSRRHAEIRRTADGFEIDNGSIHGTFINGQKIDEKV